MEDELDMLLAPRAPTPDRPLLGLTVLVVEDSRFASEAMRLLCLRSGARIRRADSLQSARRHLAGYRPAIVIVDLGLPDGSGSELIAELGRARPRVEAILGMSGEPEQRAAAMAAGADDFLEKPIESLAAFQAIVLRHLPPERRPAGPRPLRDEVVRPDPHALMEDLAHVTDILTHSDAMDSAAIGYAVRFLAGLARMADDPPLQEVAARLSAHHVSGEPIGSDVARIAGMVHDRLARSAAG